MGTDIHLSIEYKEEPAGLWYAFGADIYMPRDYRLFGLLAGVRDPVHSLFPVRGIPGDISWEVDDKYYSSDGEHKVVDPDWHTPSWLSREEWVTVLAQDFKDVPVQYRAVSDVMRRFENESYSYITRVVFWFDN